VRALFLASFLAPVALATGTNACAPHSPVVREEGDAGEVVLLADPPDGGEVTWDGWAGPFVADYCVQCHSPTAPCGGSGCHPGCGELPDFTLKSDVVSFAQTIQCGIAVAQNPHWSCAGVTVKEFPVDLGTNPLPTNEQRGLMVDWIEAGCP
jgi:hypothetical protein